MKTKHTPGPWNISPNGYRPNRWKISYGSKKSGDFIKICEGSGNIRDARLIAAAPELLEALQFVVESRGLKLTDAVCDTLQKTINKAKGE